MAIRQDNSIECTIINEKIDTLNNKKDLRDFILKQWILETPNSKYRYFVEQLTNEKRIYLERPGRLNKGCDFVIYIENHIQYNNGNDKPPPHNFIIDDLKIKKQYLKDTEWDSLIRSIESLYNCEKYQTSIAYCNKLPIFGETYEVILKTLRWLFIEQDITYWSGQGREMLYSTILKI